MDEECIIVESQLTEQQVTDYTGTANIGNMTGQGGLAAAHNGVTSAPYTSSAAGPAGTAPTEDGYVGKTWAAPKIMSKVIVYGSDGTGTIKWCTGSTTGAVTLTLYGKNGSAPANKTDGTSIGSTPFTDGTINDSRTVTSTDLTTAWDHNWILISNASQGGGSDIITENVYFEMV